MFDTPVPYNHMLARWWEAACLQMEDDGINVFTSGFYGNTAFDSTYNIKNVTKEMKLADKIGQIFHALSNSYMTWNEFVKYSPNSLPILIRDPNGFPLLNSADIFTENWIHYLRERYEEAYLSDEINTQIYGQKVNLYDKCALKSIQPFYEEKLLNFYKKIPEKYRKIMYAGITINKPVERVAMLGKLPNEIISRTYGASLSGIQQINSLRFIKENPGGMLLQSSDSCLVKKGWIDSQKLSKIIENKSVYLTNCNTIILFSLLEIWLQWSANRKIPSFVI